MIYHSDPDTALDQARAQLKSRPGERMIVRTQSGYRVINPREPVRHYGVIVARMTYAREHNPEQNQSRRIPPWIKTLS